MNKSFIRWMFAEVDGSFSWRKGLAFMVSLGFLFSIVAYFVWDKVLPKPYQITMDLVVSYYFFKKLPEIIPKKINRKKKENTDNSVG